MLVMSKTERNRLAGGAGLPTGGGGLEGVLPGLLRGTDGGPVGLDEAIRHLVRAGELLRPARLGGQHAQEEETEGGRMVFHGRVEGS